MSEALDDELGRLASGCGWAVRLKNRGSSQSSRKMELSVV
jgi:hypothetical protein